METDTGGGQNGITEYFGENFSGDCSFDEPLDRHCRIRTGGEAAVWAEPANADEVIELKNQAAEAQLPLYIVGLGSNILFPDGGLDAVVCRLTGHFQSCEVIDEKESTAIVRVGGGIPNALVVRQLHGKGLTGMEFLKLIPGTFGGTVAMNGGTKEKWTDEILKSVALLTDSGSRGSSNVSSHYSASVSDLESVVEVDKEALEMSYRSTNIDTAEIVLEAIIEVQTEGLDEAKQRLAEDKDRREQTQPYRMPSVGSTFVNPEDDYAGRLIDEAGLKGQRVGGAVVSDQHANFLVNDGNASTADVIELMSQVRAEVYDQFGVWLEPEVQFVGFNGKTLLEKQSRLNLEA